MFNFIIAFYFILLYKENSALKKIKRIKTFNHDGAKLC
jgi:hypothetical protein